MIHQQTKVSYKPVYTLFIGLGLFLLALLVRLPYLGTFMTIDEVKWIEGAGQFATGLANGNLLATYWHFHPGITITWIEATLLWIQYLSSGAPDLTNYVLGRIDSLADIVGIMRLSPVLITAIGVVGLYWLAKPMLGHWATLLGASLLAVDPFFVAHSRIVNGDAASAILMMLAFLAFANLWQKRHWSMVVLSGVLAGLAMLTKLPAPIILAWVGLLVIPGFVTYRNWRYWLGVLILFGAIAVATFVLLFPAMWVNPFETLRLIYLEAFNVGGIGEGHDTFFLGNISNNPGWLFYPYAIAFRLTPITAVGLLAIPFWLWRRKRKLSSPPVMLVWALLAYIIFVYLFANTSPKKLDRYLMAVIPPLLLLAGTGWAWLVEKASNLATSHRQTIMAGGTAILITVQALFVIQNYPYVLTYYNPLLGGFTRAVEQVPVGWGEGMEQAAAWINNQPDAQNLQVSTWYRDMMQPYLRAETVSFSSSGKDQLTADYVIFYINQIQRQNPNPALVAYFTQKEPVFQVEHNGTPYVWVYPAPHMQSISGKPTIEGRAQLLGYKWHQNPPAQPEDISQLTLYMHPLGNLPENETFHVALASSDGILWGTWQSENTNVWHSDTIVEWQGTLTLPPETPPDDYYLTISLIDKNTNSEVTRFPLEEDALQLK